MCGGGRSPQCREAPSDKLNCPTEAVVSATLPDELLIAGGDRRIGIALERQSKPEPRG